MLTKRQHIINRKIIMLQAGKNIPAIARKLKMSPPAIHMTINGERTNEKTQKAICKILKVSPEIFWPEFYGSTQSGVVPEKGAQDVCVEAI